MIFNHLIGTRYVKKEKNKTSLSSVMNITLALALFCHAAPSKNIFHGSNISINKIFSSGKSSENFHSSRIG
jgi:hypothetical protein